MDYATETSVLSLHYSNQVSIFFRMNNPRTEKNADRKNDIPLHDS